MKSTGSCVDSIYRQETGLLEAGQSAIALVEFVVDGMPIILYRNSRFRFVEGTPEGFKVFAGLTPDTKYLKVSEVCTSMDRQRNHYVATSIQ